MFLTLLGPPPRQWLSLTHCRRALGKAGAHFTDDQLSRVRRQLYELAGVLVDIYESTVHVTDDDPDRSPPGRRRR